ncbi:hypothetical protein QTQ03_16570 [Micromonospora sp. WMMA1363]|uniref:hypothetical protein n=1 Tax=Micromonospora sp. WMMA1363 TaxID=3053985 RepID=UPI00259D17F2|nr:hypothetical protein [Micromonospora sp. WMMA1363]MDM4721133.1 hypothetical protein [Micromonospora sp. WMMA1363]
MFCLASNDEDFGSLVECTRRRGHDNHHCDSRKRLAWDADGEVECFAGFGGYDHGQPPNRKALRGTFTHPNRAQRRILK